MFFRTILVPVVFALARTHFYRHFYDLPFHDIASKQDVGKEGKKGVCLQPPFELFELHPLGCSQSVQRHTIARYVRSARKLDLGVGANQYAMQYLFIDDFLE